MHKYLLHTPVEELRALIKALAPAKDDPKKEALHEEVTYELIKPEQKTPAGRGSA